jgi:long-chain acyl-CoA synthetase
MNWGEILKERIHLKLPKTWFTHNLFKNFSKNFFKIYFRFKGEGVENIPDTACIIAPNHQSFLDGMFVAAFLRKHQMKKTYFYAKEKHVRKRWVKFLANRNNIIVMNINKDLKLSIQKMAEVLKRDRNIIIFPEGTRTKDGKLGDFKKTFAILSKELNVPVVPVAIYGAYEALPRGKKIPRLFSEIRVQFLKPVYPEAQSYDDIKEEVVTNIEEAINIV